MTNTIVACTNINLLKESQMPATPSQTELYAVELDGKPLLQNNISNCITEIPQDIKLELNNGTLTLKAGSKFYVPNGAGVFDEITTQNDYVIRYGTVNTNLMICMNRNGNGCVITISEYCYSGSEQPSTTTSRQIWYNTTDNTIKTRTSGTTEWTGQYSLPIAIVDCIETDKFNIKQIFNGFGYIGGTIFVLPGVKGLIPNGRNADGSLKNIEVETSAVSISSGGGADQKNIYYGLTIVGGITLNGIYSYDYINNYTYDGSNKRTDAFFGKYDKTSGQIVNFKLATAFHALDYNDLDYKFQLVSALPSNPDPNVWYAIPE